MVIALASFYSFKIISVLPFWSGLLVFCILTHWLSHISPPTSTSILSIACKKPGRLNKAGLNINNIRINQQFLHKEKKVVNYKYPWTAPLISTQSSKVFMVSIKKRINKKLFLDHTVIVKTVCIFTERLPQFVYFYMFSLFGFMHKLGMLAVFLSFY